MTQPTAYNQLYDHSVYADMNPSAPFHGGHLDDELAAIELTLDGLCTNLALLQRDDGKLANRSVHPDALAAGTLSLMGEWEPRGAWVTATHYAVRDVVEQDSFSFVCLVEHTSGTFTTDRNAGKWQCIGIFTGGVLGEGGAVNGSSLSISGNGTIGGTLGVTGLTTLTTLTLTGTSLKGPDNFAIQDTADSNRSRYLFSTGSEYDTRSGGRHIFKIAGTEAMRLTELGNLTVTGGATDRHIQVTANSGFIRDIHFASAGSNRWTLRVNGTAESGGDSGSAFQIVARDDGGTFIDFPMQITRAAGGQMTLARPTQFDSTVGIGFAPQTNATLRTSRTGVATSGSEFGALLNLTCDATSGTTTPRGLTQTLTVGSSYVGTGDWAALVGQLDVTQPRTLTTAICVHGFQNVTAAAAITTIESFRASGAWSGGPTITNAIGYRSILNTGIATSVWNIYADGTAANHFAGDVLIGTTTASPDYKFYVQKLNTATSGISYAGRFNNGNTAASPHSGDMYGMYALAYQASGSGTITDLWGVNGEARVESGGGAVTGAASGVRAVVNHQAASTIGNAIGVHVASPTNTGGGTITTDAGGSTLYTGIRISSPYASGTAFQTELRNVRSTASAFIGFEIATATNHPIRFATNQSTEDSNVRMTILAGGNVLINRTTDTAGAEKLQVDGSLSVNSATMLRTYTSFTNGAGASAGTLSNAPSAGNPTKWIPINDNGTTRHIPAW